MKRICKGCGHPRKEHEKMGKITPCVKFHKRDDGSGLNASVCACKDFQDV